MSTTISKIKAASKVVVALIGFVLGYLNEHLDVVPASWRGYVTAAIALATLLGIYQAPHGALPGLLGFRPSARRSAARKRHPVNHVKHPAATHPAAAVDHPAPRKSPGHTSVPPKDAS